MKARSIIALAASLVLNFAVIGALDWSAREAQAAPTGHVLVSQLPEPSDMYASVGAYHAAKAL